jgi:hypothetical protein
MEDKMTRWRKSSHSGNGGSDCVEAASSDHVYVRDSKDKNGPHLEISPSKWHSFTSRVKTS